MLFSAFSRYACASNMLNFVNHGHISFKRVVCLRFMTLLGWLACFTLVLLLYSWTLQQAEACKNQGSCFKLLSWWAKINPTIEWKIQEVGSSHFLDSIWRMMSIQLCKNINPLWSWALLGIFGTQGTPCTPAFGWSGPFDWSLHCHLKISRLVGCA